MEQGETLTVFDTLLYACSVEFCPIEGYREALVCGTYQLNETTRLRAGSLWLHRLDLESEEEEPSSRNVLADTNCQSAESGILDCKWSQRPQRFGPVLASATATGQLFLHALIKDQNGGAPMRLEEGYATESKPCLYLSLDWDDRLGGSGASESKVVVSQSDGKVSLWRISDSEVAEEEEWDAHSLFGKPIEVWVATFDPWKPDIIYTGADDTFLKAWDKRVGFSRPASTVRHHTMGVCSISGNPHLEHVLASGSYDGIVRLWDVRSLGQGPVEEIGVEGGVWRLKWHPSNSRALLAGCMHEGSRVIITPPGLPSSSSQESKVVTTYTKHQSMTYGADWWYGRRKEGDDSQEGISPRKDIIATCSFYDHGMHIWRADVPSFRTL